MIIYSDYNNKKFIYSFIFYLFNAGNKNKPLKVYRKNSFSHNKMLIKANELLLKWSTKKQIS